MRICLLESTYSQMAVLNGKVVGMILGHAQNDTKKSNRIFQYLMIIKHIFYMITYGFKEIPKFLEYSKIYKTYDQLIKGKKSEYDGTIVLFAVSKDCRGLGIGKALLEKLKVHFKLQGVRSYYLYTDTQCTYQFYDRQGLKRSATKSITLTISNIKIPLEIFLYSYHFE